MSGLVTVDDLEFDKIHYISVDDNNFWDSYRPPNDPNVWEGEVREVVNAGPSAIFTFTGSQVSVFGRVEPARNGSQQPLSLYSVGSQNLQAFVAPNVTTVQDNVVFFNSSMMPYDQYDLIINVSRASADAPYFLDYIRFNTTDPNTSVSSSSNSTSSTMSESITTSSTSGSGSPSAKSSSAPVGAIVGGVIGGVALIAATTFAFFCYRLRKRGSRTYIDQSTEDKRASPTRITPYVVPSIAGSQNAASLSMAQHGSTHSFSYNGGAPTGMRGKAALARAYDQVTLAPGPASVHGGGSAYELSSTAHSVNGSGTDSGSGTHSDLSSHARPTHTPSPHSTVHDLPNIANTARTSKTRAGRSERIGPHSGAPSASISQSPAQHDSGMRFQPGLTPSNVAPVLPPGVPGPIRSAATQSEVARADIPPAYTPE
ncbi:hypothetical protein LXA43DRAFT_976725 [Ganoderma leucocontextum]|nr:hypothetical protein LXA43DRAFT_976725 [Ganoderma leucocontextum]